MRTIKARKIREKTLRILCKVCTRKTSRECFKCPYPLNMSVRKAKTEIKKLRKYKRISTTDSYSKIREFYEKEQLETEIKRTRQYLREKRLKERLKNANKSHS